MLRIRRGIPRGRVTPPNLKMMGHEKGKRKKSENKKENK